jgi:hypothetical protein
MRLLMGHAAHRLASALYLARTTLHLARTRSPREVIRFHIDCSRYQRGAQQQQKYKTTPLHNLRHMRRSDTVFIFGSGGSLATIGEETWKKISMHDTFGFNFSFRQKYVRMDLHLLRELRGSMEPPAAAENVIFELNEILHTERYRETILLLQDGWLAELNRMLALGLVAESNRIVRYKNRRGYRLPSSDPSLGITHGPGTLTDCVNIAYCLGWKRIVLIGVDLYDSGYFWLPRDEPRKLGDFTLPRHDVHPTVANGIVPFLGEWQKWLRLRGVELYNANPHSLLCRVLPLYPLDFCQ